MPGHSFIGSTSLLRPATIVRTMVIGLVYVVVWWVLTEGAVDSWMFGIPFALLAGAVSVMMSPASKVKMRIIPGFRYLGYFLYNSVVGGLDVAIRALHPKMPLSPGFVACSLRLPGDSHRALLADTVSLLPGTLSAGLENEVVILHVLDVTQPVVEEVRKIEQLIADTFGLDLGAHFAPSETPNDTETGNADA